MGQATWKVQGIQDTVLSLQELQRPRRLPQLKSGVTAPGGEGTGTPGGCTVQGGALLAECALTERRQSDSDNESLCDPNVRNVKPFMMQ